MNRLTAWRDGVRRTPGGRQLLKIAVFLLGVYIWSTEFAWADRLKDRAVASAREAWDAARRKPVTSAVVTGGGVLLAVVGALAVRRYDVVDRVTGSFG